jgi:hypothetical protein
VDRGENVNLVRREPAEAKRPTRAANRECTRAIARPDHAHWTFRGKVERDERGY